MVEKPMKEHCVRKASTYTQLAGLTRFFSDRKMGRFNQTQADLVSFFSTFLSGEKSMVEPESLRDDYDSP